MPIFYFFYFTKSYVEDKTPSTPECNLNLENIEAMLKQGGSLFQRDHPCKKSGEKHPRRASCDGRCKEQRDETTNQTTPRVNRHHLQLSSDKEDVSEEAWPDSSQSVGRGPANALPHLLWGRLQPLQEPIDLVIWMRWWTLWILYWYVVSFIAVRKFVLACN